MSPLEAIQLERAEQQTSDRLTCLWRDPDEPQAEPPKRCWKCDDEIPEGDRPRPNQRLCRACGRAGYVARRCRTCDAVLRRVDVYRKRGLHLVGYCSACRRGIVQSLGGAADPECTVTPKRDLQRGKRRRAAAKRARP